MQVNRNEEKKKRKRTIESSVPCNVMDVDIDMYGIDKNGFVESSYQVNDDISIPVYADVQLYPCSNCGRSFNAETLVDKKNLGQKNVMTHFVFS